MSPLSDATGNQFLRLASGVAFDLLTPDDLLQAAMDKVIELTGATKGFLILVGANRELEFKVARNMNREEIDNPEISTRIIGKVMDSGQTECIGNAAQDPRFDDSTSIALLSFKSIICAPLRSGVDVIGVIFIENRLAAGVFDRRHQEIVERVAEEASLAMGMTRTLESLRGERDRLAEENRGLREVFRAEYEFGRFIGRSEVMNRVAAQIAAIAQRRPTVLIQGESGTGKELVARILHATGPWRDKPFIAVNCAAVPHALFESEMFGHVKGAFTSADRSRAGKVEAAEGGTLFLDEVGDMPMEAQPKLLRLLEERTYERVGENHLRSADIRVIAATNRGLVEAVNQHEFRQDLYYRLNQLPLALPSLRERPEDVDELALHFLRQEGRAIPGFTRKSLEVLRAYSWPGNVRELKNVVMRAACYTSDGAFIDDATVARMLDERPLPVASTPGSDNEYAEFVGVPYRDAVKTLEERYLRAMIERHADLSRTELADELKLARRTLFQRMRALGITGK